MSLLVKAVLVALVTWLTFFDKYCTQFFTYRPIVIGPIIGLIMGDLKMGLMVGCTIELMFLGQVFVGTALPPEETFSTIIATAFACNFRADGHVLQKYGALCMDSAQARGRCRAGEQNRDYHELSYSAECIQFRTVLCTCFPGNLFRRRTGPGNYQCNSQGYYRRSGCRRRNDWCCRTCIAAEVY